MNKQVSTPVIVAIVVVFVILAAGFGWYSINRDPPLRDVTGGSPSVPGSMKAGKTGRPGMNAPVSNFDDTK